MHLDNVQSNPTCDQGFFWSRLGMTEGSLALSNMAATL